jgi:hypothetical protein
MPEPADPSPSSSSTRGRGRGKSRGGLGKYLRARGRGRGFGRPAEFTTRLVLEGEGTAALTEEEQAELARETAMKYSRRQLGTNADRYKEEEVELDSDGMSVSSMFCDPRFLKIMLNYSGEPILEPEVDLSSFLERQRISDEAGPTLRAAEKKDYDDDDVDTSLSYITSSSSRVPAQTAPKKGKIEEIAWDESLDEMTREKKAAEATWGAHSF